MLVIYIRISQITIPCFLFRFWNKFEDCPGTETSWFLYYLLIKMYGIQHVSQIYRSDVQREKNCNFYVYL